MQEMYENLLQQPLVGFDPLNPENTFKSIAVDLMKDYCIRCGNEEFYFAEIEFYYYRSEDEELLKKVGNKWEGVTYLRTAKAGDFFYHLSGVDVCFNSKLDKSKFKINGEGGGILIRSIIDKNKNVTAGPLNCVNTMLNACGRGQTPFLYKKDKERKGVDVHSTYRYLGDSDFKKIDKGENKDGKYKLAFYDKEIDSEDWTKARPSYYSYRFKYELH